MTNIAVSKYYQSLLTQFIIGCILYIITFFIITDITSNNTYQKYKYYICVLIIVDAAFLVYLTKMYNQNKNNNENNNNNMQKMQSDKIATSDTQNTSQKRSSNSMYSPSLTSEMNDIRITHDISSSDLDNFNLFSTSEEEKDIIMEDKNTHKETSNLSDTTPSISFE